MAYDPWNEIIPTVGSWSQTYVDGRESLDTGKVIATKSEPTSWDYEGALTGIRQHFTSGTHTVSDANWHITSLGETRGDLSCAIVAQNCDKIVVDNLKIKLDISNISNTCDRLFYFLQTPEVYINNCLLMGAAFRDMILIQGAEYALVQNTHITGIDYGSGQPLCCRGIYVHNGETGAVTNANNLVTAVIQNNYICNNRALNHPNGGYFGAIEVISPADSLVFNNVIENWDSRTNDSIPFQVSTRRLPTDTNWNSEPYGNNHRCRVARNILKNPTPAKDIYVKLGHHGFPEQTPAPDNLQIWESNIWMDTKIALDEIEGATYFVNNTFLMDGANRQQFVIWLQRIPQYFYNNIYYWGGNNPGTFMQRNPNSDSDDKFGKYWHTDYNLYLATGGNMFVDLQIPAYSRNTLVQARASSMENNGTYLNVGTVFNNLNKDIDNLSVDLAAGSVARGIGSTYFVNLTGGSKVDVDFNGTALPTSGQPDVGAIQYGSAPQPPAEDAVTVIIDNGDAEYSHSTGGTTITGDDGTEANTEVFDWLELRYNTNRTWLSNAFMLGDDSYITDIVLTVYRSGTPEGNMWIEIYDDNSGVPGSIVGALSSTVVTDTLTAFNTGEDKTFTWDIKKPTITANTKYWIVVKGDFAIEALHYVNIRHSSGVYAYPVYKYDGSTWTSISNIELCFTMHYSDINGYEDDYEYFEAGSNSYYARWEFTDLPALEQIDVYVHYPTNTDGAEDIVYTMEGAAIASSQISQLLTQGQWVHIFSTKDIEIANYLYITLNQSATGVAYADACKLVYIPTTTTQIICSVLDSVLDGEAATITQPSTPIECTYSDSVFVGVTATIMGEFSNVICTAADNVLRAQTCQVYWGVPKAGRAGHIRDRIWGHRKYKNMLPDEREKGKFTEEDIERLLKNWPNIF